MRLSIISLLFLITYGCDSNESKPSLPPTWPIDAELVLNADETWIEFTWPNASDDVGIDHYQVRLDEQDPIILSSSVYQYRFEQLMTAQSYMVSLRAVDNENQISEALKASIQTPDRTPPVWQGGEINLQSISSEAVDITWSESFDNVQVSEYRIYLNEQLIQKVDSTTRELVINGLEAATRYVVSVEAQDSAGHISTDGPSTSFLTPDELAPTWPDNAQIYIAGLTDESVELTWEPAQDDVEVSQYELVSDVEEPRYIAGDGSSIIINGLQADSSYSFSLIAIDTADNRSTALETMVQTNDSQSPMWPGNSALRSEIIADEFVKVVWPIAQDNGTLVAYEVLKDLIVIDRVEVGQNQYEINGLVPGESYLIQVVAIDRLGHRSPPLMLTVQTTDSVAPQWSSNANLEIIHIREGHAQVRWPAANDNVGVSGYRVDLDETTVHTGNQLERYTDLHGLVPNVSYLLAVYAQDLSGQWSSPLTMNLQTEDETPPSWPVDATVSSEALSETEILIEWPAANDNVGLSAYIIHLNEESRLRVEADTLSYEFSGLQSWTNYGIRIEAEDSQGQLSLMDLNTEVRTLDETPPVFQVESSLRSLLTTSTEALLTWQAATDNGELLGYALYQNAELIANLSVNDLEYRVDELLSGGTYEFTLEAIDAAGNHSEPQVLTIHCPDSAPPVWPESSQVIVSNINDRTITLNWTEAQDNVQLSHYHIYHQNVLVETVAATVQSTSISNLTIGERHVFRVEAEDSSGQMSVNGPTLSVDLSDQSPPSFSAGAALSLLSVSAREFTITWPPAVDDVSVVSYRVELDGILLQRINSDESSYILDNLSPLSEYTVQVFAEDGVGQSSLPLTIAITTDDLEHPQWPPHSELNTLLTLPDSTLLTWTTAIGEVDHYLLEDQTGRSEIIPANATEWTINELSSEVTYLFSLFAVGPTGLETEMPLSVEITTPSEQEPTWPPGAELQLVARNENSITVEWSPLASNQGILYYILELNGEDVGQVESSTHRFQYLGLNLGEAYNLSVNAQNTRGQRSTEGPMVIASTQDVTPPTFSNEGSISITEETVSTLHLDWPMAFDNVAVVSYRIYIDEVLLVELPAESRTYLVQGLLPGNDYAFRITAVDEAGLESIVSLTEIGRTRSGDQIPSDEEVRDALAPHCSLCHETWFISTEAMQTHLIAGRSGDFAQTRAVLNRAFVIPGDPENSLLIELLEGRGPEEYDSPMMPPTGFGGVGADFATLSANGQTAVSMLQLRDWIEIMEISQ